MPIIRQKRIGRYRVYIEQRSDQLALRVDNFTLDMQPLGTIQYEYLVEEYNKLSTVKAISIIMNRLSDQTDVSYARYKEDGI